MGDGERKGKYPLGRGLYGVEGADNHIGEDYSYTHLAEEGVDKYKYRRR